jgi:cysteine-rich repeat protein
MLPCGNWSESGSGYRYRDKFGTVGGVQKITYRAGKLVVSMRGAQTALLHGPVDYVEFRFSVGASAFCGRFENITINDVDTVSAKKPSIACTEVCGDEIVDFVEDCDDGNAVEGDGCDTNCTASACGNGIQSAVEHCDDGNVAGGDGCRSDCTVEACGDGIVDPGEECDDGNLDAGDCCDSACQDEDGMVCSDLDNCTTGDVCVGAVCTGTLSRPWINEYDYDDFTLGGVTDIDEFVEIAGPTGTDIGGYQVIAVEGNHTCQHTVFTGVGTGEANFSAVIPPNTVLGDDTGTGVGLYVVCFTSSSASHIASGDCDVVLPAPSTESNLRNGHLVNADTFSCPDGILLLDPVGNLADAVSYEGIVPNVGNYGPYFNVTPYNGGQDQGWKARVSFEKTSGVLRATSASDWQLSGGCTNAAQADVCAEFSDSPGLPNPGQALDCDAVFCGDTVVTGIEECDEGAANSNASDATCRVDCTARRCGDGIIDPGFGENCESHSDCGAGMACDECNCVVGTFLGPLTYTVIPGPSTLAPVDDGESSWMRVTPIVPSITSGSQGDFNEGPLLLLAGIAGADGIAELELTAPAYIGAQLPALAGAGKVCFRIEQDPSATGFVDCDGGSSAAVSLTMNSNGTAANGSPVLVVGGGGDDGPGAAVVRVLITGAQTTNPTLDCSLADYSAGPSNATGLTTATATSRIDNPLQGGAFTLVSLGGQPFDCGNWTPDSGASIVLPNTNADVTVPVLGTYDFAQCLRLNDD